LKTFLFTLLWSIVITFPNYSSLLIFNVCYPFRGLYNSLSSRSVLILHTPPSEWYLVLIKMCLVEEQRMTACVNATWLPQLFTEVAWCIFTVSVFLLWKFIYIHFSKSIEYYTFWHYL
jgi:hypothetical protein